MARFHDPSKERFWRRMLAGWKTSGLTIRAYCHRQGLAEASFYTWRRQLAARQRRDQASTPATLPLFVPVDVEDGVAAAVLEVVLVGNRTIRVRPGFDRSTLAQVLALLEERSC